MLSFAARPFGLTYTPSSIIASRLEADNHVELLRLPLGLDYQNYYQAAIRNFDDTGPDVRDMESARSMFREAGMPMTGADQEIRIRP